MKLPEKKRKELEKEGKPPAPQVPGGGAMGRLRQFEKERGLDKTNLGNQATDKPAKRKAQKKKGR